MKNKKIYVWLLIITIIVASVGCTRTKNVVLDSEKNTNETSTATITETTTEVITEVQTEPPTEAQTEPPTEAPSVPTLDEQVESIINEMTLHEKVCQMFVVAPEKLMGSGTVTYVDDNVRNKLFEYPVAGFIFFAGNLVDIEQTKTMLNLLQNYSLEINGLPFYTCVDEEGGRVARIGNNPNFGVTKIQAMSNIKTANEAYDAGLTIGNYLNNLGFNFNFAPDADVITNPLNSVIGDRSFGSDGDIVSYFAVEYAKGLQSKNVLSTFKHFPGHGATEGDTHEGFAYTSKSLDELMNAELKPFVAAKENGIDAIMVAHISVPTVLGDNTPCTLSKYMITDVLRNQIGFEGLIITDALGMGAIANEYEADEAAVKAILAGNDLLLMPEDFYVAYDGVMSAISNGVITEERLDESLRRIIKSKILLKM